MFVVTLSKASVKKLGVGAMCCALVVFSAMLGRYISTRSVAVAAAGNKIESAQDIQTWFTGRSTSSPVVTQSHSSGPTL